MASLLEKYLDLDMGLADDSTERFRLTWLACKPKKGQAQRIAVRFVGSNPETNQELGQSKSQARKAGYPVIHFRILSCLPT